MRRTAFLVAAAITAAALAVYALTSVHSRQPPRRATPASGHAGSTTAPLGIVWPPDQGAILARLDSLTLALLPPRVDLGEYHYTWSLSPDGAELALGISAPGDREGLGIRIVDLRRMAVVRDIPTGIAAEAVGWLAPRRLAAVLQSSVVIVVDPATGTILRRWELGLGEQLLPRQARTPDRLAVLLAPPTGVGPARLAVVGREGRLRTVLLAGIRIGDRSSCCWTIPERAGLAVDPARERAFAFAAGAPAAEVDLQTMRVRSHPIVGLRLAPPPRSPQGSDMVHASWLDARWLGNGLVAVAGEHLSAVGQTDTRIPAGVAIVDTRSWRARTLPVRASAACPIAGKLLVYAGARWAVPTGPGIGVRVYDLDGRQRQHLLGDEQVAGVLAAGGYVYARSATALWVIDYRSGAIIRTLPPTPGSLDLLGGSC
jgi:hypothetical protein